MHVRITRITDEGVIHRLHKKTFPGDEFYDNPFSTYWVAATDGGHLVGFCIATPNKFNEVFLTRAGVIPCARGHGLQKRFIRVRQNWAQKEGYVALVTYTSLENGASIKSLLDCGLRVYDPDYKWAGDGVIYFIKKLD